MGDVKLAEKFIEQKLGHDAVAEFRAYMKEARRDARKVARDKELANRPDLLRLHVDLKYTYGGDFMFEEGTEYFEHESLLDYLNNSLGLAITNHFEKGYFKLESTCKYISIRAVAVTIWYQPIRPTKSWTSYWMSLLRVVTEATKMRVLAARIG